MSKEKISLVWIHFEVDKEDKNCAECKLCKEKGIKKKDNTSNLWSHLKNKHIIEHKALKDKENSKQKDQSDCTKCPKKTILDLLTIEHSKAGFDKYIAYMIVLDLQPYNFVEGLGFQCLMKNALPKYELPGRKYFTSYVQKLYNQKVKSSF